MRTSSYQMTISIIDGKIHPAHVYAYEEVLDHVRAMNEKRSDPRRRYVVRRKYRGPRTKNPNHTLLRDAHSADVYIYEEWVTSSAEKKRRSEERAQRLVRAWRSAVVSGETYAGYAEWKRANGYY